MANECVLYGIDAAMWGWNSLWQPEQTSFSKIRILDAIMMTTDEGLNGWLFTSITDGSVKSKTRQNWTAEHIIKRCIAGARIEEDGTMATQMNAHVALGSRNAGVGATPSTAGKKSPSNELKWKDLSPDKITNLCSSSVDGAIVCFNMIGGTHSFAEVIYELGPNSTHKVTTYSLYSGSVLIEENHRKGMGYYPHSKLASMEDSPSAVPSHRQCCINKETTSATTLFTRDLIKQIESRNKLKVSKLVLLVLLEVDALADQRVVWLHHCREVTFQGGRCSDQRASLGNSMQPTRLERRNSTLSDVSFRSDMSSSNPAAPIRSRCVGDFCCYDENDESKSNAAAKKEAKDAGNIKAEVRNALRRHHPEEPTAENATTVGEGGGGGALREDGDGEDKDPPKTGAGAHIVPFKSIALARHDMVTYEHEGRQTYDETTMGAWSEALFYWWLRHGRARVKKGGGALPASSGHFIQQSLAGLRPRSGDERVAAAERRFESVSSVANTSRARIGLTVGSGHPNSLHSADDSDLGSYGQQMSSGAYNASDAGTESGSEILFDLTGENSFTGYHARSMGQVSWFYSGAKVCDTCYTVYRDMDRRRIQFQSMLLKKQRKVAGQNEVLEGREIERRIFQQRKFATRMSKNMRPAVNAEGARLESAMRSQVSMGSSSGAPHGILPPLPWQLRDNQKQAEYEHGPFVPSFIRNIRVKAQQMASLVKQDQMMERIRRAKISGKLGGDLDQDSVAESLAPDFDWRKVTGADRTEEQRRQQEIAKSRQMKVIGGLGENRPKPRSKDFDPNRLMHGWQKDIKKWREDLKGEHEENFLSDVENGHTGFAAPIKERKMGKRARKVSERGLVKDGGPWDQHGELGMSLQQGSTISQLTLDPSIFNEMNQPSVGSLSALDDDAWIKQVIGGRTTKSGRADHATQNSLSSSKGIKNVSFNSNVPTSTGAESRVRGADFTLRVSHGNAVVSSNSNSNSNPNKQPQRTIDLEEDDDDDDEDDDEGEGIGWSPFVIPGM